MLQSLKKFYHLKKSFYGINSGNYGFLMNKFSKNNFIKNLKTLNNIKIHPLEMIVKNKNNILESENTTPSPQCLWSCSVASLYTCILIGGIAHFPAVAGGLVDAAMPLIGRRRSQRGVGRTQRAWARRGSDQGAAVLARRSAARRETSESFQRSRQRFRGACRAFESISIKDYHRIKANTS